jgi:penicillin-binding protein 1A
MQQDDTRYERQMRRRRGWYVFFRTVTVTILAVAALSIGFVVGIFLEVSQKLPKGDELAAVALPVPTRVLAADGSLLGRVQMPDQNREIVPLAKMGQHLIDATLAIEDERYYYHPGIDPRGIARAMVKNYQSGDTKEGASTITQQLARNLWLSRDKNITRKLQEMVLALELERRFSKDEILETYLNQVFYGSNKYGLQSWGAQMAARTYYGKDAKDMTLAEAALLAGLPKNPNGYNPYSHPTEAKHRRNLVLSTMRDNGAISNEDFTRASEEPVKLKPEKELQKMADAHAAYFVDYILRTELDRIFGRDRELMVYRYGLVIHTTLDPRIQKHAEEVVTSQVRAHRRRNIDDGALVAIDPKTGFIKAMVGGTNFDKDQFNIVTQGHRQPGSAFKPFVYTAALLHGYTPTTTVSDTPGRYPMGNGNNWTPRNSDGKYRGAMQLQQAVWASRNAAAARVADDVKIGRIIDVAYRMGIRKDDRYPLSPVLATSLGASAVLPLDICSAYGTLANHGVHNQPTGIRMITNAQGEVLYEAAAEPTRAIPTEVADTMKKIMRGVVDQGTGTAAQCSFPVSGKTGTTNSYRDAWFIGFTEDLATAVWVGNRSNEPMNRTFGGTVPAPIFRQFMEVAQPIMRAEHQQQPELVKRNTVAELKDLDRSPTAYIARITGRRYVRPRDDTPATTAETVTRRICRDTGLLATRACPTDVRKFVIGVDDPPSRACTKHGAAANGTPRPDTTPPQRGGIDLYVCPQSGNIATTTCPSPAKKRFYGNAPRETCPLHQD